MTARKLRASAEGICEAARALRGGRLVAFPTETVYGLGANAFDPRAVALIFEAKGRPWFDPLIVHVAETSWVDRLCSEVPPPARSLISKFWPGPLTLVLPRSTEVPDVVTAGLSTVAVRMPAHDVALALVREAGTPVAAPSANKFGRLSPTTAEHVMEQLGDAPGLEIVLDGGSTPVGVESTIVKVDPRGSAVALLRPGGLPLEALEGVVGKVRVATSPSDRPEAPGLTQKHYAPACPVWLVDEGAGVPGVPSQSAGLAVEREGTTERTRVPPSSCKQGGSAAPTSLRAGYLAFRRRPKRLPGVVAVEVLSPAGDLREAAARLFAALHRLEAAGVDVIIAERVPERGLGRAIMNRLSRAAGGSSPS